MRTPILALLGTLVCLATGTLSASELPRLPLDDIEQATRYYTLAVVTREAGAGTRLAGVKFGEFDSSKGSFRGVMETTARGLTLDPPKGREGDEYMVSAYGDLDSDLTRGVVGLVSQPFRLEETQTGWKIPNVRLEWTADYNGQFRFLMPTVTDWQAIIWQNGAKRTFSTREDFKQFSQDERGCEFLSIQSLLRYSGIVAIPAGIALPETPWERLELTLWEGMRETVFEYQRPEPARPKIRPLTIGIRLVYGLPMISVSGDGAEFAVVQQRRSLTARWEPARSLSQPPTKLSINGLEEFLFAFEDDQDGEVVWFYRAFVDY